MDEFTNEQKNKLKTWAEQRDELLGEIANLTSDRDKITITNRELAESKTRINNEMFVIQGRIQELQIKESELPTVISKEVAFLQSKRATLEGEITVFEKVLAVLKPQKAGLEADVEKALAIFEVVKGESLLLNKITDEVTSVSKSNTDKINSLVSNLAISLEDIIAVNRKNVQETNVVIEKLPAMLIELQKRNLIKPRQSIIKSKD